MYNPYPKSPTSSIVRLPSEPLHKEKLSRRHNRLETSQGRSTQTTGFNFLPTQHPNPSVCPSIYPQRTTAVPSHKRLPEARAEHQRRHRESRPHIRKTANVQPTQAVANGRKNYSRTPQSLPVEGPARYRQKDRMPGDKISEPATIKSSVSRRSSTDGEATVVGSDDSDEDDARIVKIQRAAKIWMCAPRQLSVVRKNENAYAVSVVCVGKYGFVVQPSR